MVLPSGAKEMVWISFAEARDFQICFPVEAFQAIRWLSLTSLAALELLHFQSNVTEPTRVLSSGAKSAAERYSMVLDDQPPGDSTSSGITGYDSFLRPYAIFTFFALPRSNTASTAPD